MKAEEFIKEYTSGCSNELVAVEDKNGKKVISYHEWLTPEQALAAVEIAREEVIMKAYEWIEQNAHRYLVTRRINGVNMTALDVSISDDFRSAMKE